MPVDFVTFANVVLSGLLTGCVYGLMALGLSVIFGVARLVNFAHGEIMTLAMYAAVLAFHHFELDPFVSLLPIAALFFAFGYALQAGLINRFVTRPDHVQFLLLLAWRSSSPTGCCFCSAPKRATSSSTPCSNPSPSARC